eukprot:6345250-Prymnesium_polylepis.1
MVRAHTLSLRAPPAGQPTDAAHTLPMAPAVGAFITIGIRREGGHRGIHRGPGFPGRQAGHGLQDWCGGARLLSRCEAEELTRTAYTVVHSAVSDTWFG